MQENEVIQVLQNDLNFSDESINKLKFFNKSLIIANKNHNFISKSTVNDIWNRHILDSAQIVKYIDFNNGSVADLGTGAGFPGIVIALFNKKKGFHVKLYEKSPVKRKFLEKIIEKLNINAEIYNNVYDKKISAEFVVARAFKKLDEIIQVSREIVQKPHKLIVLKGQNAQEELNKAFKTQKYPYKIRNSITDEKSKIIIIDFN